MTRSTKLPPRRYYVLDKKHRPVQVTDMREWAKSFEPGKRIVAKDSFNNRDVSTVFLGIDHRIGRGGPPILFETMIFAAKGDPLDEYQQRCSTWDEALKMHEKACLLAKMGGMK